MRRSTPPARATKAVTRIPRANRCTGRTAAPSRENGGVFHDRGCVNGPRAATASCVAATTRPSHAGVLRLERKEDAARAVDDGPQAVGPEGGRGVRGGAALGTVAGHQEDHFGHQPPQLPPARPDKSPRPPRPRRPGRMPRRSRVPRPPPPRATCWYSGRLVADADPGTAPRRGCSSAPARTRRLRRAGAAARTARRRRGPGTG